MVDNNQYIAVVIIKNKNTNFLGRGLVILPARVGVRAGYIYWFS